MMALGDFDRMSDPLYRFEQAPVTGWAVNKGLCLDTRVSVLTVKSRRVALRSVPCDLSNTDEWRPPDRILTP